MNKIVWVFGCSASGKETFIRNVLKNKSIINDLAWNNKKLIPVIESIDYIKQYEKDPIEFKRLELIDKVNKENSNNSNSIILIKGQNYDFNNRIVELLKEQVKNAEYLIIFLYSDLNTCFERMKQKSWYIEEEDGNIDEMKEHMIESAELVQKLNIPIIAIDTTDGYKVTDFPY